MREQNMWNRTLMDLVFPRRCPICDAVMAYGEQGICNRHKTLPYVTGPVCMKCGKELSEAEQEYCEDCRRHTRSFKRAYPVFRYEEPVASSVLAIKYHNKREYVDYYGNLLAERLRKAGVADRIQIILPVPIHKRRRKKRGYNQAELLAEVVGRQLHLPVDKTHLLRVSETAPQKELSPLERANNIKQALEVKMLPAEWKTVLLIDDIYTTGATVQACTEALQEAGVEQVYVGVICVGDGR